ncbi:sporulation integral membrane protein YlbJ [Paenibacillus sp. ACRRX]|uniref:sporulation integral membrane protein YlbJ n=1 Tax=unclassified Paenibacillus TaxID=185978 RepID=UPI001EF66444|nr:MULTISPECIES: sporulation integral membrane protein YlbJ [unclassified Paenibacillus]MCG7410419.1 sporulation integral membrane protein YlbJ [Paenibacillus sp. ACRRX]MDK8183841.1 sporulation integral membrane protein YlbJ [Paenibacillus sp. UMB4589-SE434]
MSGWRRINLLLTAALFTLFLLLMLRFPGSVLSAAVRGLAIWWDVLFPSLLPFFIISEALLGFGIVHFIGALLDPIMRPLFRVPGVGGFVVAMGYAAGYPVGAKLTTRLRSQGMITREEGERLVAFTTTSDPIFLIGAVSVGFFGNPGLALTLAAAHYGSGLILGVIMRFYRHQAPSTPEGATNTVNSPLNKGIRGRLIRAFQAMHTARVQDGRPLGLLLRDAVESSLKLMIVVGGLVVFFSVVLELLTSAGVMKVWDSLLGVVLHAVQLPDSLAPAFSGGLFEVTLGAKGAGSAYSAGLHMQAVAAAWILSWAGLSVHAQIASILNQTDLRYMPFLAARLIHSMMAAAGAYLLYPWLYDASVATTSWLPPAFQHTSGGWNNTVSSISYGIITAAVICILLALLGIILRAIRLIRS